MKSKSVKPWNVRGWVTCRIKELGWQGLSWPYLLGIAMTIAFLRSPSETLKDAMLFSWLMAFGNRALKAWQVYKANGARKA